MLVKLEFARFLLQTNRCIDYRKPFGGSRVGCGVSELA